MKTISTIQKVMETVCRIRSKPIHRLLIAGCLLLGTLRFAQAQTGDYGDAPASYEQGNPARHTSAPGFLAINTNPDVEAGPNSVAAGANCNAAAGDGLDEDAFWKSSLVGGTTNLPDINMARSTYRVYVPATLNSSTRSAKVCAWIDFNRNGTFDANERACVQLAFANGNYYTPNSSTSAAEVSQGLWQLEWTLPAGVQKGVTYARFRIAFDDETGGNMQPTGAYTYGEVEDYQLNIVDLADNINCGTGFSLKPFDVIAQRQIDTYTACPNYSTAWTINDATGWQDQTVPTGGQMMVMNKPGGCFSHVPAIGWTNQDAGVPSGAEGSIGWLGGHSMVANTSGEGATANLVNPLAANKVYRGIFWATRTAGVFTGTAGYIRFYGVNNPAIGTANNTLNASNSELLYQSPSITNTLIWKLYAYTFTPTKNWQYIRVEIGTSNSVNNYIYFDQFTLYECQAPDRGDAPLSYGDPLHTIPASGTSSLYLGAIAPDGDPVTLFTSTAQGDDIDNVDDEGGPLSTICTIAGSYSTTVSVVNSTANSAAKLIGWIDFNRNGTFEASEGVSVPTPTTGTYTLTWTGLTGLVPGITYGRFRVTTDATVTTSTPASLAADGEVEDWAGTIVAEGGTITASATSLTTCSAAPVSITYTTVPSGQVPIWTVMPGGQTGSGNVLDFPVNNGTTPVSYTYTAYIPSVSGCPSNTAVTVVTVNPKPTITPSQCSQTICSGQTGAITFTSNIPGETIHWTRTPTTPAPSSGTGNIGQSLTNTGPASLTYTYTIWADYAGTVSCATSNTITCVIVVDNCCSLSVTASASSTAVCVGQAVTLATSISGNVGAVTYAWVGPNGFTSNVANPTLPAATSATAGTYTVFVSDPTASTACTRTASVTISVGSLFVSASSNSPVCTTGSLSLTGIATGGSGTYTYAWSGPNGFVSSAQNPTLALSTTAQSGNYNLLVTDTQGCSGTATTPVIVATQPNLSVTGSPSQTICSGQSTTLAVAGANGAPVSWTNTLGQTGTGTSISSGTLVNAGSVPMVVTYRILASTGSCSDEEYVQVVVNPEPRLQVVPNASVICNLEQTNITVTANPATASITWTRTPNTPNPPAASGSGTGSVTINQVLPPATYIYSFTATSGGCSSTLPATVSITVQQ